MFGSQTNVCILRLLNIWQRWVLNIWQRQILPNVWFSNERMHFCVNAYAIYRKCASIYENARSCTIGTWKQHFLIRFRVPRGLRGQKWLFCLQNPLECIKIVKMTIFVHFEGFWRQNDHFRPLRPPETLNLIRRCCFHVPMA